MRFSSLLFNVSVDFKSGLNTQGNQLNSLYKPIQRNQYRRDYLRECNSFPQLMKRFLVLLTEQGLRKNSGKQKALQEIGGLSQLVKNA